MQVNNNVQSPNFGMALKIGKGGKEYLVKQSEDVMAKLGKIGEEMKDYKYWDFFVTEKGYEAVEKEKITPRCYASRAILHFGLDVNKNFNNRLQFDTFIGGNYANSGSKVSLTFNDLDPNEVENVKRNFKSYNQVQDYFAEFVRFLERRSTEVAATKIAKASEKAAEEAEKAREKAKINSLVDNLVARFPAE